MSASSDSRTSVACARTSLECDAANGNDIDADGDVDGVDTDRVTI